MKSYWILVAFGLGSVAWTVLAGLNPTANNWAVHHYGFLTGTWWTVGALAGATALLASLRKGPAWLPPAIAAAGAVVFWVYRPQIFLLGDGDAWQRLLDLKTAFPAPWYGSGALLSTAQDLLGTGPARTLAVVSVSAGVLYLAAACWLVRSLKAGAGLLILLAAPGAALVFAGQPGPEAMFCAMLSLFLVFGWLTLTEPRYALLAGAAWVLAALLSGHVLLFLPAMLLLVLFVERRNDKVVLSVSVLAGVVLAGLLNPQGLGGWWSAAAAHWKPDFFTADPAYIPYSMFSPGHLMDVFQEHLLLGPAAMLSAILLLLVSGFRARVETFLTTAAVPAFLVSLVRIRELGAARDWDVFVFAAIPWVFLTGALFYRRLSESTGWRWAGAVLAGCTVFHFVGWVGVQQANSPVRHMEALFGPEARVSQHAYSEAFLDLSDYFAAIGDTDRAIGYLARNIEADPKNEELISELGDLLYRKGRADEAVSVLLSVVATSPDNADLWFQLGLAQREMGSLAEADSSFRNTVRLDPEHLQGIINLHRTLRDRGDMAAADSVLSYGESLYPDEYLIYMGRGVMEELHGRLEPAAIAFENALRVRPDDPVVLFNLGRVYLNLGRFQDSEEALEKVLAKSELDAEAWVNLGIARENLGKPTEAMLAHRRALEIDPRRPEPYFHLSRMLLAGGNTQQAMNLMQAYAAQDSTSEYGVMARTVIRAMEREMKGAAPQQ